MVNYLLCKRKIEGKDVFDTSLICHFQYSPFLWVESSFHLAQFAFCRQHFLSCFLQCKFTGGTSHSSYLTDSLFWLYLRKILSHIKYWVDVLRLFSCSQALKKCSLVMAASLQDGPQGSSPPGAPMLVRL